MVLSRLMKSELRLEKVTRNSTILHFYVLTFVSFRVYVQLRLTYVPIIVPMLPPEYDNVMFFNYMSNYKYVTSPLSKVMNFVSKRKSRKLHRSILTKDSNVKIL